MEEKGGLLAWIGGAVCGLLLVLSFAPVGWWWCGWLALAPAWLILRGCAGVRQKPMRFGYVVGLVFVLGCFWWVGGVTASGLLVMALVVSCYPALWFLLVARVLRLPARGESLSLAALAMRAGMAAAFWVTLEWLRRWTMSGFIWNELGVSQVPQAEFRQLAALSGPPLLTFVLVAVGVLIGEAAWCALKRRRKQAGVALLAAALVIAISYGYGRHRLVLHGSQLPRGSLSYACIQPNIPELPYARGDQKEIDRLEVDAMNQQQELSARAIAGAPELLIWPEAITTQRLLPHSLLRQVMDHIQGIYRGSVLVGAEEVDRGKLYNTAYLLEPSGAAPQRYRKVYLVIMGEYLPLADIFPWLRQWWGGGVAATAGTQPGHLLLTRQHLSLAPLICFEDTEPQVVDPAAALGPDFFVTLVNAGWYTGPLAEWCLKQHLQNAILRCVEHDRPMIRCADTGITCEISAEGEIIAQLPEDSTQPLESRGILARQLTLYPWAPTLYDKWGDWVGLLSRLATLVFGVRCLLVHRKALLEHHP